MSRALCAPDSFKGTLSAAEVAAAMAAGLRDARLEAEELPLADGGEGTAEALLAAEGGELRSARVSDPLGRLVDAGFALLGDGTAVVEVAAASGLGRVAPEERDAWAASSRGTGELIAAAAASGASAVLVAAGGSATTDGGAGALEALREAGRLPPLRVLCDVAIPFERAPALFAPQKGADEVTVLRLERRLDALAAAAPSDPRGVPMSGAAGGLAGGLWAELGAELVPGADHVLDRVGFDRRLAHNAIVVTGEGRLDAGTLEGKLVGAVAARCATAGAPCHAVVGATELGPQQATEMGLASVRLASTPPEIRRAAGRIGRDTA